MKIWNYKKTFTGHDVTDAWLAKQAIWHDSDLIKFVIIASIISGGLGFLFGWSYGQPDLSGVVHTGIIG
jgi:hypothetical protein